MLVYDSVTPFITGGCASIIAELITFPIDLVKVRLQLQGQKACNENATLKYRGMIHALSTIPREEGLAALYSGIKPAVLRQATYGTLKIGFYQKLKQFFPHDEHTEPLVANIICGATSGALANGIANPTDVLKVRMQAKSSNNLSMTRSFIDMAKHEGLKGLYRGVLPNMQRAAIITSIELPVYDSTKSYLVETLGMNRENFSTHVYASLVAGGMSALAATPIDVVKTRLMNQKVLKNRLIQNSEVIIYKGLTDCFIQTVKFEGVSALFKGLLASYLRLGPWNLIFFVTYEKMMHYSI